VRREDDEHKRCASMTYKSSGGMIEIGTSEIGSAHITNPQRKWNR
jgi:hypothetical protein